MADIDSIKKAGFRQLAEHVRKDLEPEDLFLELEPDLLGAGYYVEGEAITEAAEKRYHRAKEQMAERIEKLGQ